MSKLSIILPIFNEEGNIDKLFKEIIQLATRENYDYEIIAVNDGSADNSLVRLKSIADNNNSVKIIDFKKNYGQTAAINAGIKYSSGDVLILIDSDLENDPKDIPALLNKLDEGYDVVSGWRSARWKGNYFSRKLPSIMANWIISKISGLKLHDYGCTLKVYNSEYIKDLKLYGDMHRFIPAYLYWQGARVAELKVNYRKREYGESNYNILRTFRVLLDLVMIKFLEKYMNKPIHFFGGLGFISFFIGALSGFAALVLKILDLRSFVSTPLPIFSALFIIVGVQLLAMGIIAEVIMRTYYESQGKETYQIKNKINIKNEQ